MIAPFYREERSKQALSVRPVAMEQRYDSVVMALVMAMVGGACLQEHVHKHRSLFVHQVGAQIASSFVDFRLAALPEAGARIAKPLNFFSLDGFVGTLHRSDLRAVPTKSPPPPQKASVL